MKTRNVTPSKDLGLFLSAASEFAEMARDIYGISQPKFSFTGHIEDLVDPSRADEFDRGLVRPWVSDCGYDPLTPVGQMLRGLLYSKIAQSLARPKRLNDDLETPEERKGANIRFWAGAKSQQLLAAALESAESSVRQYAYNVIHRFDHDLAFTMAGALAVARASRALRESHLVIGVRTGTLYEDLALATDLVVTSKHQSESGCLLQVKATLDPTEVYLVRNNERPKAAVYLPRALRNEDGLALVQTMWEIAYRARYVSKHEWHALIVMVNVNHLDAADLYDPQLAKLLKERLLSTHLFGPTDQTPAPSLT